LFPNIHIEDAMELNRTLPHVSSAAFGFSLRHPAGQLAFQDFCDLANTDAFCGPWANSNGPDRDRYQLDYLRDLYPTAPCGPADVRGHRHDQTALSVIAWRFGLELDTTLYAHANGTPEPGEKVILYHSI
jgi:hypothetical protein